MNWSPFILSLKLALVSSLILFAIGIPLCYSLSRKRTFFTSFFESLFTLPLILPPSVLGFYLLICFKPDSPIGSFIKETIGLDVLFSFTGLVIASLLYSLPFMLSPILAALNHFNKQLKEASYSLGMSPFQTFLKVELPLIKPAILSALVLTFAHTIGEFGVVLMIGGSIPGKTEVASIALFNQVESLHYEQAHRYALILMSFSFMVLFLVNRFKNQSIINA